LTNDIMYRRMFAVLNKLFSCERKQSYLHSILFEDAPPRFEGYSCSSYYNDRLNDVQKKAVDLAVTATDIALIHGPPGTGKTCTVVEIIRQLVARGKRLLVCGPSNVSVDNIGESLVKLDILFNRVGHPSKVSASVAKHGKNCLALAKQQSLRAGSGVNIYAEIHVILSTLCGAGDRKVDECGMDFDVVIIDECAQALEAECWIAAIRAPKLILAGDHHQLPPTLINSENKQLEMKAQSTKIASVIDDDILIPSLFMRAQNMLKDTACRMLKTQYRMNRNIMRVSSDNIYDGCLIASKEVESHLLSGLPNVDQTLDTLSPLVYIDTSGAGMPESFESGKQTKAKSNVGKSIVNKEEARLAVRHVKRLVSAGVCAKDIALVSPYSGQVSLLQSMCEEIEGVEIRSIDGFQGSEKEAVVLTMVRSNPEEAIGFLCDYRRINVAITRARRHLCVIADGSTISKEGNFLKALIEYLNHSAATRTPN
ncbi:P-loop containing nucleoside triphosphate hydrolase protein, partial [Coemansia reversa NRRL 1564]